MRQLQRRRGETGTTLVELAVASFLLAILLGLTHLALIEGVKKQKSLREDIALQQDALALLARISREASEGHSGTFWPDRSTNSILTMPGGAPVGFVFLSPRDGAGRIQLDPSNNRPVWQKRVCYYFEPANGKVYRAEDSLAAPSSTAPPRDDSKTTQWFKDNRPGDPLPGVVESFEVEVGDTLEQLKFNITLSTQQGPRKKELEFLTNATLTK
ncbi:MAG TPA: hypothetical protein EYO33_20280 [Phycisphaerales bacterium]|nr:hypothetical protein [Phycisphaerales bacterium]